MKTMHQMINSFVVSCLYIGIIAVVEVHGKMDVVYSKEKETLYIIG